MSRAKFYTSLAACLLILCPILQAEPSKPASLPATAEASNAEASSNSASAEASAEASANAKASVDMDSPLLMKEFYPLWMEMDITEAPALMQALIEQLERQIAEICQLKAEEMNYENTFGALEKPDDQLSCCYMSIIQLSSISDSEELRKLREEISMLITTYQASLINNVALWKNLNIAASGDWVSTLSPAKKRFIQSSLNYYKDDIEKLAPEQKKRKQEILEELGKLELTFEQNLKDSTKACVLLIKKPEELAGMDKSWMNEAAQKALDKGYGYDYGFFKNTQWLITMNDERHVNILYYCEHEATRRACWQANAQIAKQEPYDNEPIIHRIAQLRQELAELLGFKNFASYKTKHLMIAGEPNMRRFLEGMIAQLKPSFDKESAELLAFISEKKGKQITKIDPWDQYYYLNLLKEERYPFDEDKLYDYFPQEGVTQGMFCIFEQLFNIRFEEKESYHQWASEDSDCYDEDEEVWSSEDSDYSDEDEEISPDMVEVWDSDVKIFDVFDASSNKHLGSFYLDLFYRDKKRASAWTIPTRIGISGINGRAHRPHLATLACNFESLLSHDQVQTLFHEMGHILHFMLSKTELPSQGSPAVVRDFVEFPSQLAALWAWSPQVLGIIAKHHETSASIPDEMMKQLVRSQHFMSSIASMEQLSMALLDLELHSQYGKLFKGKSLDEASRDILKDMRIPFSSGAPSSLHSFTHCLSAAYASNYYSYKWGEVLAADAFSRFLKDGILNRNTGTQLRETILSKGDSAPAMELFKNFMGREPNSDALIEQQAILRKELKNN